VRDEERIARLEKTLGTLIVWLETTLGSNNVHELLNQLNNDSPESEQR